MELRLIDPALLQEWIVLDRPLHLVLRPRNNGDRKPKVAENLRFDFPGQRLGRKLRTSKNHISTLDVRLDLLESQLPERLSKLLHLDRLVPANVDSAQHRNIGRHDSKD